MRFGFACPEEHELVHEFRIGEAPLLISCAEHGFSAPRVFESFYTQEDRRGMAAAAPRVNAPRPDWSWALGAPMPTSRAEMRAIEKARGIEFVTPAEARADAKKLREGKNLDEPPKLERGYLAKEVAKRGIRFDRSLSPPRQWTREEAERKLKAETKDAEWGGWDSKADAEAKVADPAKLPG